MCMWQLKSLEQNHYKKNIINENLKTKKVCKKKNTKSNILYASIT